ncbi:MAG: hypothetical protein ACP5FL_06435, partial [Thermoplasmatota archaeon]
LTQYIMPPHGVSFTPTGRAPVQPADQYIGSVAAGGSTPGYYLGMATVAMPANVSLHWRNLSYVTFTMNESLGAFDVTFINLSRTALSWPTQGNLLGAQLGQGAKLRIWNVPLHNVTVDLEQRHVHVDLFQELSMFFYIGAELEGEPLNVSGLIGAIPAGDIDIYCNLTNLSYQAADNIDLMAAVISYMGLTASVGLTALPNDIDVAWDFKNGEVGLEMNDEIGSIYFSAAFNYRYLRIGDFPPPAWATKDTTIYLAAHNIPGCTVNWSNGIEYTGQMAGSGANIVFKLFKKDHLGNYEYMPLTRDHGLTLTTTLYTPTNPLHIKTMGIIGNFNTPSHVSYTRTSDDATHIAIEMDQDMTDVLIQTQIKFISPNIWLGGIIRFDNIPHTITISFEKNLNHFTYTADRATSIDAYLEYGPPALITTTPHPPLHTVGLRLNDQEGDIACKGRIHITIPTSFHLWYRLDKQNHSMQISFTASSAITNGVDINAYIDHHIGGVYIRDTTLRASLSNIPTQINLSSSYHIQGGSMEATVDYQADQSISQLFAGIKRPDLHGVQDWAAYFSLEDIPTMFTLTVEKGHDFPVVSYTASASTLDVITWLDGTRFQDLVQIPHIDQLPYLQLKIIDIPAHGVTINYNKASQRCSIRTNEYPTERVGEFTVNFNIVVSGSYDKVDDDEWGLSWVGVYYQYWVHLFLRVGVREYILEVKDWNKVIIDLNTPEIILTIDGLPTAHFYMKWRIHVQFSIDAGFRAGLFIKVCGKTYRRALFKLDADWSHSGAIQLHNYVWDNYWPYHSIRLLRIKYIISAGLYYYWPTIHHSVNEISLTGPNTYHWMISPWHSDTLIKIYIVVRYWGRFRSGIGWWYDWW